MRSWILWSVVGIAWWSFGHPITTPLKYQHKHKSTERYLSRLMTDESVDVVLLQETDTPTSETHEMSSQSSHSNALNHLIRNDMEAFEITEYNECTEQRLQPRPMFCF